jgi:hypothetical protein
MFCARWTVLLQHLKCLCVDFVCVFPRACTFTRAKALSADGIKRGAGFGALALLF